MIQYILECIAFQLMFLIIYDFFLKRETFFQWNRAYLIGTYVLSLLLPWIKIEAFRTEVPQVFNGSSEFFWNLDQEPVLLNPEVSQGISLTWKEGFFLLGVLLASVWFILKMWRLYQLRTKGIVNHFKSFTQILVPDSHIAFSFFKSIFLGEKLPRKEYEAIISHELVHINQRHSLDLLFFELMRILNWFNPLVYVYQNRIAELHEFIADAQVPKSERKAHYDLLLSQVFKTQNISFVNQFFKSSLIKKRIVMLQKSKSKKIWQLKYLLLVPILLGMLGYTSLEKQKIDRQSVALNEVKVVGHPVENSSKKDDVSMEVLENVFNNQITIPIFPACKNESNMDLCFQEQMRQYVIGNLKYPKEALKNGHQGLVLLVFDINENGKVSNIKSRKMGDSSELLEGEAKRVISSIPVLIPANDKGKPVPVQFSLPITFILNDERNKPDETTTFTDSEPIPFAKVENVPVFPDCENDADKRGCFFENMREHIRKNFNYPKEAQEKGIQGQVNTMFTIDEKGAIINLKMRGPDSLLTNEAARIISRLPIMKPGIHEGEVVKVAFSIPITFKLNDNSYDKDASTAVSKYDALVAERKRLLQSADERNPIIINLDQQIKALQESIDSKKGLGNEVMATKNYDQSSYVPFVVVNQVPVFPGCENAADQRACFRQMLQKHISQNFKYPKEAQENGIQGRVNIMFDIEQDGNIGNIRMRGPDKLLEDEAERIISLLPQMIPGRHKGRPVIIPFSVPITFRLQGTNGWEPDLEKFADMTENIPIFYVDGERVTKEQVMAMNQDEIESIFALKGEVAIKKYGQEAQNGVLEIVTKKKD